MLGSWALLANGQGEVRVKTVARPCYLVTTAYSLDLNGAKDGCADISDIPVFGDVLVVRVYLCQIWDLFPVWRSETLNSIAKDALIVAITGAVKWIHGKAITPTKFCNIFSCKIVVVRNNLIQLNSYISHMYFL